MAAVETTIGTMMLLPPAPGRCQTCATTHGPHEPHNAQSLYYQMAFQMEHGRGPDWRDAMAHCADDVRELWTRELVARGVDVAGGGVNPAKGAR